MIAVKVHVERNSHFEWLKHVRLHRRSSSHSRFCRPKQYPNCEWCHQRPLDARHILSYKSSYVLWQLQCLSSNSVNNWSCGCTQPNQTDRFFFPWGADPHWALHRPTSIGPELQWPFLAISGVELPTPWSGEVTHFKGSSFLDLEKQRETHTSCSFEISNDCIGVLPCFA